jgi:hypothetical protein
LNSKTFSEYFMDARFGVFAEHQDFCRPGPPFNLDSGRFSVGHFLAGADNECFSGHRPIISTSQNSTTLPPRHATG